jgi:DNA-binding CsgD family transcriptional regulator
MRYISVFFLVIVLVVNVDLAGQPDSAYIKKIRSQLIEMPVEQQVRELRLLGRRLGPKNKEQALWAARFSRSLAQANEINKRSLYNSILILGNLHKRYSNIDSAKFYYNEVLKHSQNQDSSWVADAYLSLGSLSVKTDKPLEGVQYYLKAVNIFDMLGDMEGVGKTYTNIANLYSSDHLGEYQKAMQYYNRSLQVFRSIDFKTGNVLLNKAGLHRKMEQPDSAIYFLSKIDTSTVYKIRYLPIKALAFMIHGQIMDDKKEYGKALYYYAKADSMIESTSLINEKIRNYGYQAKTYFKLENFIKAVQFGEKANDLLTDKNNNDRALEINRVLGNSYYELRNYKKASLHLSSYIKQKDKLVDETNKKQIREVEAKYQNREKEKEIEYLKLENDLNEQKLTQKELELKSLFGFILLALLAGGIGFYSYRRNVKMSKKLLNSEVEELKAKIKAIIDNKPKGLKLTLEALNGKLENPLSEREFEVLHLTLEDLKNQEIADEIHISINTVKFHLKNIYEKIGVKNRKEILNFVIDKS